MIGHAASRDEGDVDGCTRPPQLAPAPRQEGALPAAAGRRRFRATEHGTSLGSRNSSACGHRR